MEAYCTRIKVNAESLAKETFPKKALELDELINVSLFNSMTYLLSVINLKFPEE